MFVTFDTSHKPIFPLNEWADLNISFVAETLDVSQLLNCPVNDAAKEFGSQCIVSSIDVKLINNEHKVFINGGKKNTNLNIEEWLKEVQDLGAGEIFLNSIDKDGSATGYDEQLIEKVSKIINVPLIICGGVGSYNDFEKGLKYEVVDAVAAANFFHYKDQSVYFSKKYLYEKKLNIREPQTFEVK